MDCIQTPWLSDQEYIKIFNRKVVTERIPLSGTLELTRNCNLSCAHCYLGGGTGEEETVRELDTHQWFSIIDEITAQGCLYLLITGGEPLLVKDFQAVYTYAKKKGLIITVFTNGTLVTENIAVLFKEYPPQGVEITLYGAKPETYERITGKKGSYAKCLQGIRLLLDYGINVKLKTVLTTLNQDDFCEMENMANIYGVKFRFDAAVFPCFNGDRTPLRLRIQPHEVVEKEFSNNDRYCEWQDYYHRMKEEIVQDSMYSCGAGLASFHVNAQGYLTPCLMVNDVAYDLTKGDFLTGWHGIIHSVRKKKLADDHDCKGCDKRVLCGYCPAFFKLENGVENKCSEYLCAIGQLRYKNLTCQETYKEG